MMWIISLLILANATHGSAFLWSDYVAKQAQVRAHDICLTGDFSHDKFYARQVMGPHNPFSYWGENLARGFNTPEATHQAFLNSPLHKKNLEGFTYIGIAYDPCPSMGGITVELFTR